MTDDSGNAALFAARRPDLLHLSPQALTQLANAGLVKRAQREQIGRAHV